MAARIYRNIFGPYHKEIVRLNRKQKDELEENIAQTMCHSEDTNSIFV